MARRFVRAFCIAGLVGAGLAPTAQAGSVPAVAGETVIVAAQTSKMRVYVPARAKITIDPAKSFDVEGPGRIVGVILREVYRDPWAADNAGFIRLPAQAGRDRVYRWGPGATPTHYDLRRGTYTLIALTDGAPVRLTLRFANLGGSVTLRPGTRVASGSAPLVKSVDAPVTWSAGASITTPGPADVITFAWWQQDESPAAEAGHCAYDGDGLAALGTYRWVPGCPAGSSTAMGEVSNPLYGPVWMAKGGAHSLTAFGGTTGGKHGTGVWTAAQNVRAADGFAYWFGT